MALAQEKLLDVSDLRLWLRSPRGAVRAVDGVSFAVRPGEKVALVGESGCGKSMTARAILGLTPQADRQLCDGQVAFEGRNLLELDDRALASVRGGKIAMVFQDPLTYLNPRMTIRRQIAEAIWLHRRDADIAGETSEFLERVGLRSDARVLDSYPHELSGGMRQRVMIAMALAPRPRLLIADEPTTALDVTLQAQILNLLDTLCHDLGLSLVMITHDMGVVAELCDTVHVMYAGRIVESGPTVDLFENPRHPYTRSLIGATLSVTERQSKLRVLGGSVPDLVDPPAGCRFQPRCAVAFERCEREPPSFATTPMASARCWHAAEAEMKP